MTTAAFFDIKASDKTKEAFNSVTKKLKGLSINAAKAAGAVAVVSGTALTGLALSSAKSADALAKQADKIGITTEKLASLHYMTEQYTNAGVGAMSEALTKAEKRLGEFASNGGGAAAVWLKKLNLDVNELKSLSPDQLFQTYAESIRGLNSRGEQLAATSALMGDESRALINIIDAGPEAFRKSEKEAKAFGLTLSRIEVAKIEAAGDAVDKVQQVFKGIGNKLAVRFSVYIEEIANRFNDAAFESNGFGDAIEGAMKSSIMAVGYFLDVFRGIEVVIKIVELGFAAFGEGVIDTIFTIVDGWRQLANVIPGIDIGPMENFAAITKAAGDRTSTLVKELDTLVTKPMPSENFENFINVVNEKSEEAAKKVASIAGGKGNSKGYETVDLPAFNEDAFQMGLIEDSRRKAILEDLELKHQAKLGSIEAKGEIFREKFRKMSSKDKAKNVFGEMAKMTQGVAQNNKALFEVNKISAMANAGISAYEGISLTLSKYPYPLNIGLAALHGAAAFAQISAIGSTSFQGGGGGTTPSLAGSAGTVNSIPVATQNTNVNPANELATKNINISIEGDPSKQQVRDLIEAINEEAGDGFNISMAG